MRNDSIARIVCACLSAVISPTHGSQRDRCFLAPSMRRGRPRISTSRTATPSHDRGTTADRRRRSDPRGEAGSERGAGRERAPEGDCRRQHILDETCGARRTSQPARGSRTHRARRRHQIRLNGACWGSCQEPGEVQKCLRLWRGGVQGVIRAFFLRPPRSRRRSGSQVRKLGGGGDV